MKCGVERLIGRRGSRIFRGVGVLNDADEIPVAAGIISSTPIMDMTHTYWDGKYVTSCDECTSGLLCPNCPQYGGSGGTYLANTEKFHTEPNVEANYDDNIYDDTPGAINDLKPDYMSSREKMGACSGKQARTAVKLENIESNTQPEDKFGVVTLGGSRINNRLSSANSLTAYTLGVDMDAEPTDTIREYRSSFGYIYKESEII